MNVTYLKDRYNKPLYVKKTAELLPYDLDAELIAALEQGLSELDKIDMPDEQKRRIRESM